jgi:hypothetical protein
MSMLAILFAVLDANSWSVAETHSWADALIMRAQRPADWLVRLSSAQTSEGALAVVSGALVEFGQALPEDFGDTLAGLIYLKYEQGESTWQEMLAALVDAVDAYQPNGLVVEQLKGLEHPGSTDNADLAGHLQQLAMRAGQLREHLRSGSLYERERDVIES